MDFDLIVIGAGPAGYVAAIRAAQAGMKTACVEKNPTLGGTCLNIGCIPSKALLHSSELYHKLVHEGKEHGILADPKVDFAQMQSRKTGIVKGLTQGIEFLFKKNKVTWLKGEARFTAVHTLDVGGESHSAKHIIIASGSEPIPLPFLPFDETTVLSSTGALALKKVPKKMLLVGAGVIGLELGSVYRRLGSEVTVVELLDRVCPMYDAEISAAAEKILKQQGMTFHLGAKVVKGDGAKLTIEKEGKETTLEADVVLVAIGRRPYAEGLGLDTIGVERNKQGQIIVDGHFQTSVPGVYAIGDVIDGPMLAHKASEEGMALVDLLSGHKEQINYLAIPNVMYTWPEIACVGFSEEEAKKAGLEPFTGTFPFAANPRARCSGDAQGLVKIVGDKASGRLVGLHIIGPGASEMIGEGVIGIEKRLTVKELALASHAHPTCSEAIKEAALAALGQTLHL